MTQKQAAAMLRAIGITLKRAEGDEYRVAFKGKDQEASAYYTNDLSDAVETGRDMARRAAIANAAAYLAATRPFVAEVWFATSDGYRSVGRFETEADAAREARNYWSDSRGIRIVNGERITQLKPESVLR